MTIKPDRWIRRMAEEQGMIEPFVPRLVQEGVLSYGLSSYGYDLRLADEWRTPPSPGAALVLDPKDISVSHFTQVRGTSYDLVPGCYVLGRSVEYLRIPPDVLALCTGKSSYARCGVMVNATPFEPGWEGYVTLCLANLGQQTVRLLSGEGVAQVLFFLSDEPCEMTYADRKGRYQAQQGVTPARVLGKD
ncbi:MAG TPA: dCTP deaminase [Anaerolineae bacterium]|nr:dCTP deaminase [Anaerolineae bacterium]